MENEPNALLLAVKEATILVYIISEKLVIKGYNKSRINIGYPVSIIGFFAFIIRFHNSSQLSKK